MAMKRVLRFSMLIVCALTGLLVTLHGVAEVALIYSFGRENITQHLAEGGVSIAGGACVLAVAFDQLECLRTRAKGGDLL